MHHACTREPAIRKGTKARPRDAVAVAPTPESVEPIPDHFRPEGEHAVQVAGDGMIVHVPLHHTAEPVRQSAAVMQVPTHMRVDGLDFGAQPLGDRFAFHGEAVPVAGTPTDVGEPEEREGLRFTLPAAAPVERGMAAELDQAGFVGVEGETEACKAILKVSQEALSLIAMLEPKDEIVCVAHDDRMAGGMTTSPLVCPQVQGVVEVPMGKQRRYHSPLGCAHRRLGPSPGLGYPGPPGLIPMRFQTSEILVLVGQASCPSLLARRDACSPILTP